MWRFCGLTCSDGGAIVVRVGQPGRIQCDDTSGRLPSRFGGGQAAGNGFAKRATCQDGVQLQRVLASPSESAPHLGAAGQDGPHDRRGLPRALQKCPHVRWQAMPFPMSLGCSPLRLNRPRLAGRRVATVSKCIGVHARPHEPAPHVGATGHEDPNVHCQPNLLPEPALSKGGGVRTVPMAIRRLPLSLNPAPCSSCSTDCRILELGPRFREDATYVTNMTTLRNPALHAFGVAVFCRRLSAWEGCNPLHAHGSTPGTHDFTRARPPSYNECRWHQDEISEGRRELVTVFCYMYIGTTKI